MKLKSVSITNFRSFESAALKFTVLPTGLVHVAGNNQAESHLGANGVGKSSLFEAVFWALYGRTSRGLKGANVRSWWANKACKVELEFDDHVVVRQVQPNHLSLDGTECTQDSVVEAVGLTADEFLHSVYFAQAAPFFLDITPGAQLELCSQVLDLSRWERASVAASERTKKMDAEMQGLRQAIAKAQGSIEMLQLSLEQAQDLGNAWAKTHEQALEREQELLSRAEVELAAAQRKAKAAPKTDWQKLREREIKQREWLSQAERAVKNAQTLHAVCETCHQSVPATHRKELLVRTEEELQSARTGYKEAKSRAEAAMLSEREAEEAGAQVRAASRAVEDRRASLQRMEKERNPHASMVKEHKSKLQDQSALVKQAEKGLAESERLYGKVAWWVKGFRDLRLWVVGDALAQLESEANSVLHELGLEGWALEFDVERETKSGGVSRGFTVMVHSPQRSDPVPWETWSGGESQRLRLACALGFSAVVLSRKGVSSNVEFWDEPTQFLSVEGVDALLESLASHAASCKRTVFLADHRSFAQGSFAGRIECTKTVHGRSQLRV